MWPNPLRISSHLLKKSLMENLIFCVVLLYHIWIQNGSKAIVSGMYLEPCQISLMELLFENS